MNQEEARSLLEEVTQSWVDDPGISAEWAGEHEGRWGIRLNQTVRDATTIWFDVGERTLGLEAYLLPAPRHDAGEVYRLALSRNDRSWPAYISMNRDGDLYVKARVALQSLDEDAIDGAVGAVYMLIELAFPQMVRIGFASREKLR